MHDPFEWKEIIMISENRKKKMYEQDSAIKSGQVHHCSLKVRIYVIYV